MTVSLTDAAGQPVSLFGTGSSQWATGTATNTAQFGQSTLFGTGLARSPSTITPTSAGDTSKLGYTDLAAGHHAPHQAPMQAAAKLDLPTSSGAEAGQRVGCQAPGQPGTEEADARF